MPGSFRIPRPLRRIIVRFAEVVCPPDPRPARLIRPLLAEFARYLGALPPHLRLAILVAFVFFDQRARLYGPARGRRFVQLDAARADAYFCALAASPSAGDRTLAQLLKGLLTLCYYELPAAQAAVGYRPAPYVAWVAQRRLATYGEAIRRAEAASLADDGPPGGGP